MSERASLRIRELDPGDIRSILGRNLLGRIAFLRDDRIDVVPIHYVYSDGSIYGRTAEGGKLTAMKLGGTLVALEVDEVQSMRRWQSVLVHGTFRMLTETGEHEEWLHTQDVVRRLERNALRESDSVPDRTRLFRISVDHAAGRGLG